MEGLEPGLVARVVSNSRLMNFSRDLTSDTMMRLARMKKEVEMLEKSQITAPILKYSLNKFFFRTFLCSMEFKYIHVGSALDQGGDLGGDQGGFWWPTQWANSFQKPGRASGAWGPGGGSQAWLSKQRGGEGRGIPSLHILAHSVGYFSPGTTDIL